MFTLVLFLYPNMKKTLFFSLFTLFVTAVFAQQEELSPLTVNQVQYRATKNLRPAGRQHKYLIDKGNIVVIGDTLKLPFTDDFTTNRLGTVNWNKNHITDTFYNVFGTCLAIEGVPLQEGYFMNDTSWFYSFDVTNQKVDSVAQPSVGLTFFGPSTSGCFAQAPSNFTKWSAYYTYQFDSASGRAVDSILVRPDDTTFYTPVIYFAQAEPGKLWADNYAYVNNTYPVNPPTIGVATLDGLNEYGLPYNNTTNSTYGTADYLTSKQINLSGYTAADSIYLSFFYEAQGLGDYPDRDDSLLLEFKDNSNAWRTVWSDTGFNSVLSVPMQFKQVLVFVPDLPFPYSNYYNTFQFRFRNKASLYGNNDHWHIDYVKLDRNRNWQDTIIYDMAFVYPFPTILKDFTLMPADQFNYPADLRDSIVLSVHNMDPNALTNPPATNFVTGAEELYPTQAIVKTEVLQTFNATEYSTILVSPEADFVIPNTPNWPVDSLVIQARSVIAPNDARPANDTIYHRQQFDNTYAYDDGSAELSYGITGTGTKRFAYEFVLNRPDTLVAFQVQFSQVEQNVSDLIFNFYAWDTIVKNSVTFDEATRRVLSLENKKPFYVDSLNGFTTYKLDTPIIVNSRIYLGWAQTDTRRLQIGYDLNSKLGKPHMLIYTGTTWKASSIQPEGSPMIRLVFDSDYWGNTTTAIDAVEAAIENVTVYPNPTTGVLTIKSDKSLLFDARVNNMIGELVLSEQNVSGQLNLSNLLNGVYLLTLRSSETGKELHKKIIKTNF